MRLQDNPYIPLEWTAAQRQLDRLYRDTSTQLNQLSEGYIQAVTNAATAAPTSGTWNRGDFIRNSAPSELGAVGQKYVIHGFICTASGTPGTWLQCRYLTGN